MFENGMLVPSNTREDLEASRDALLSLINKCKEDYRAYMRELNLVDYALIKKFYR